MFGRFALFLKIVCSSSSVITVVYRVIIDSLFLLAICFQCNLNLSNSVKIVDTIIWIFQSSIHIKFMHRSRNKLVDRQSINVINTQVKSYIASMRCEYE